MDLPKKITVNGKNIACFARPLQNVVLFASFRWRRQKLLQFYAYNTAR